MPSRHGQRIFQRLGVCGYHNHHTRHGVFPVYQCASWTFWNHVNCSTESPGWASSWTWQQQRQPHFTSAENAKPLLLATSSAFPALLLASPPRLLSLTNALYWFHHGPYWISRHQTRPDNTEYESTRAAGTCELGLYVADDNRRC